MTIPPHRRHLVSKRAHRGLRGEKLLKALHELDSGGFNQADALGVATVNALDLFAGPGGWDVGAKAIGLDPLGIEWDDAACATRKAAGLRTHQGDVSKLDPLDFAPCDLLIASPPCQAWSMAGKRQGQEDIERVYALTNDIADGKEAGRALRMAKHGAWADERSRLVTEPLRWALALRPRFIACEQVPPVLDYWRHVATILEAVGYSTWTGILSAERYGVPQTRKRAILMASLDGPVHPPLPTHQEYRAGEPAWDGPMPTLEGELLPWVSMAEALGWQGAVNTDRSGDRADESYESTEPGPTVTARARRWYRVDVPAPTVTAGGGENGGPEGEGRNWPSDGPSVDERPATNVNADPRIFPPGYRGGRREMESLKDGEKPQRAGDGAVRVTVQEASILQGFPPDYPWQGSLTKRFLQIGNAVPPPLARSILASLVGEQAELRVAA